MLDDQQPKEQQDPFVVRTSPDGSQKGMWFGGWWLYFKKEFTLARIQQVRVERVLTRVLDIIALIIGVAGFAWMLWLVYDTRVPLDQVLPWLFQYNPQLVWFFVSGFADIYVVYRLVKESHVARAVLLPEDVHEESVFSWDAQGALHEKAHINVVDAFDYSARRVLENAWLTARKLKQPEVLPIHIFAATFVVGSAEMVLARLALDVPVFFKQIKKQLKQGSHDAPPAFSSAAIETFLVAYKESFLLRKHKVTSIDMLVALSRVEGYPQEILRDQGIDGTKVAHVSEWLVYHSRFVSRIRKYRRAAQFKPKGEMNRSYTSVVTPFLDRFSHDYTLFAKSGAFSPMVGRDDEMQRIFQFVRSGASGVLLVGEEGTGRTALMEGLAQRMVEEDVPTMLEDQRLVAVSVGALVAGASQMGSSEQRLLGVLSEAQRSGNIVLYFDNIHEMVGVGSESSETLDLAQILADALERSNLRVFASTTPYHWQQFLEKSGIGHLFQRVEVGEPDFDTTIRVLESKAPFIEARTSALFSYPALETMVTLSDRYMHEERLPAKAIQIANEVSQRVAAEKGKGGVVTAEDVSKLVSEKTKIPLTDVTSDESKKLLELEQLLHRRVVNQVEAVSAVATAVRRARTELREEKRPIVNLLFLGPTGVGKTEVAKSLSEVYFGSEDVMIRLDMSEYQHEGSVFRLIGTPGGEQGLLTSAVRRQPFALVLLDEIEKAHPKILNLFLQVMDDGRLTDSSGMTVDFTNTIIIFTSNAGAFYIQDAIKRGDAPEQIRADLLNTELRQHFRPEWLNRVDNVVVFTPLTPEHVIEITKLMLDKIIVKLAKKEINFVIAEEVVAALAGEGYSPEYGARPLRRVIQERIENELAKIMLAEKIGRRDTISVAGGYKWEVSKAERL